MDGILYVHVYNILLETCMEIVYLYKVNCRWNIRVASVIFIVQEFIKSLLNEGSSWDIITMLTDSLEQRRTCSSIVFFLSLGAWVIEKYSKATV